MPEPSSSSSSSSSKLDLNSLRSYSPDWLPTLRLATAIALQFACQRLIERLEALRDESSKQTSEVEEEEKGDDGVEEVDEDGKVKQGTPQDLQKQNRKRLELVESWREFTAKFLTAACQHLGIQEETLPPGGLRLEDVLAAAQGSLDSVSGETGGTRDQQTTREALDLDSRGYETGSSFARDHPHTVIRSDVVAEKIKETKKIQEEEVTSRAEAEEGKDQDLMQDTVERLQKTSISHEEEPIPSPKRLGGALSEDGRGVEVCNELLLTALGLGQYRSTQDGATTLFEQEAIFDDFEVGTKPKPTVETTQAPPVGEETQNSSATTAENEASTSNSNAWGSIRSTASASWKWTADTSKKTASSIQQGVAGSSSGTSSTARPARKPKQPTKPTETCHYDARARAILHVTATSMGISTIDVDQAEKGLAQAIYFVMEETRRETTKRGAQDPLSQQQSTDGDHSERTGWMNKAGKDAVHQQGRQSWTKYAIAGSGFVAGGLIIGLTGGLAAPAVVPALAGLTGVTFLASSSGIVLMATLLGLGGGGLAGYRVHRRLRGIESFEFKQLQTPDQEAGITIPSLHTTICISGVLLEADQQVSVWQGTWGQSKTARDVFAVSSEAKLMAEAGRNLQSYVLSTLVQTGATKVGEQALKATALAGLSALLLPMTISNALGSGLDSLFVRAKDKARKQGLILAETLKLEVQGHRPVTLVGSSLGALTILTALQELAKDPETSSHLIDSVYLIGLPATPSITTLKRCRSIVSRRFVNGYSRQDMVCSLASWLGLDLSLDDFKNRRLPRVSGNGPIWGIGGLENVDLTDLIGSHFDLCQSGGKMEEICRRMGVFTA